MLRQNDKWRFAIGTTSRVPYSGGSHYLMLDIDGKLPHQWMSEIERGEINNIILQRTTQGWHIYTDHQIPSITAMYCYLKNSPADQAWVEIGYKRGYYFLADKAQINFPWPVEHMVIYRGKEKALNT